MAKNLNVTDALGYLDQVKNKFRDNPDVYATFLEIMKEFKSQAIDTPGVIDRVAHLFRGHPQLIEGFNTFLPVGYDIQYDPRDPNSIYVASPSGGTRIISMEPPRPLPPPSRPPPNAQEIGTTAVEYVYKIKQRCDPETYREFRDLLQQIQNNQLDPNNDQLTRKIWKLFSHDPDLRADFKVFVPEHEWPPPGVEPDDEEAIARARRKRKEKERERERERESAKAKKASRHSDAASTSHHRASHRRDKREKERGERGHKDGEHRSSSRHRQGHHGSSSHRTQTSHLRHGTTSLPLPQPPQVTTTTVFAPRQQKHSNFFDRVLKTLPSRDVYNEFLKIINLFTKGFIDTKRLLEESKNFLGKELMDVFVEIIGYDAVKNIGAGQVDEWTASRPELIDIPIVHERPEDSNIRAGSYRRLPDSEAKVQCSGRDEMCREVLNDEWILRSSYISEDDQVPIPTSTLTVTTRSKKATSSDTPSAPVPIQHTNIRHNPYLEALHRSEEERHEYGFHIDAIGRTIAMLEPICNKIMSLGTMEERMQFRVKGGFGLSNGVNGPVTNGAPPNSANTQLSNQHKPIHHRIIRKIYGLEDGNKVLQAMQDTPAMAVPVVLNRLKQREAEWKRAQSEWNKVWRLMDEANYARSLDFLALTSSSFTFGAGNRDGSLVGGYSVSGGGVNAYGSGWKGKDKRAFQPSTLVREIEILREEQVKQRGKLIDTSFKKGKKRWQLEFWMGDIGGEKKEDGVESGSSTSSPPSTPISTIPKDTMQTIHLLLFSFLDRTPGTQIPREEKKKIEGFLKGFAALFWNVDLFSLTGPDAGVVTTPVMQQEDTEMVTDDDDAQSVASSSSQSAPAKKSSKRSKTGNGGDLRKKLLKSEQAKSRKGKAVADNGMRFLADILPSSSSTSQRLEGKTVFWTNASFYVLLRLFELLYCRIKVFKDLSKEAAERRKIERDSDMIVDDSAISSAAPGGPPSNTLSASPIPTLPAPASSAPPVPGRLAKTVSDDHLYEILLDSIEKLFDNQIEQNAFEDLVRGMYGVEHSYKVYTIDKLIGAIIKQVQVVFTDSKSQDLLEILKIQKMSGGTGNDQLQDTRDKAEEVLGDDDNLFRIDWNPDSHLMTMQLIGKEDDTVNEAEDDVLRERWRRYIESFISTEPTDGVPQDKVRRPYLRRNLPKVLKKPNVITRDDFGVRICIRTYRMFSSDEGEDVLWNVDRGLKAKVDEKVAKRREDWLAKWTEAI